MPLTSAQICELIDCQCPSPLDKDTFQYYMLGLLCNLNTAVSTPSDGKDTEVILLCEPGTGQRVVVMYRFNETTGVLELVSATLPDGTAYAGAINALQACEDAEAYIVQYPICDNGVQKLARVCFSNCVPGAITYVLPDGTASTPPAVPALAVYGECPGVQIFNELACITSAAGTRRQVEQIKILDPATVALVGATIIQLEANGQLVVAAPGDITTLGQCPADSPDRELICYITTANPNPQQAWARHDDSLVGVIASNVDPGGVAYFTATNPVAPLDLSQAGLQFVLCEGDIKVVELMCYTDSATGVSRDIEIVKTITPEGIVTVSYHELDGTVIATMTADLISSGPCRNVVRCQTCRGV